MRKRNIQRAGNIRVASEGFGSRLSIARKRIGLSQIQLAEKLGGRNDSISKIERGEFSNIDFSLLSRLAELCEERGVSCRWLLTGHVAPSPEIQAASEILRRMGVELIEHASRLSVEAKPDAQPNK